MLHFRAYAVCCPPTHPGAGKRESRPRGSSSETVPYPPTTALPPFPPCSSLFLPPDGEIPPPRPGSGACGREVKASQEFAGSQIDASRERVRSFGWTGGAGSKSSPAPDPFCDLGRPFLLPLRGQEAGFCSRLLQVRSQRPSSRHSVWVTVRKDWNSPWQSLDPVPNGTGGRSEN